MHECLLDEARREIDRIDTEMARLFEARMAAAEKVAAYKKNTGMPIFDSTREAAIIARGAERIQDEALRGYYVDFLHAVMDISKSYQSRLISEITQECDCMTFQIKTAAGPYPIYLERGALQKAGQLLSLQRKCMIITDQNIPAQYISALTQQCAEPVVFPLIPGESAKSLESFSEILAVMLENHFSRTDCVIALGGGVVGDLAGFAASAYLRGIDFYNIPTTVLSQVDSSIGGKVAVNFQGFKNMVGAFYPPKAVLIDPETLSSLPRRQIANGLAEAVKMALTFDEAFFSLFEKADPMENLDKIIAASLLAKQRIVEADEREQGLRRVLNFGHTLAHAIESESLESADPLYHGECVALGMIPMCSDTVKQRLIPVLKRIGLPTQYTGSPDRWVEAISHDKKVGGNTITVVRVDAVGSYRMETIPLSCFAEEIRGGIK